MVSKKHEPKNKLERVLHGKAALKRLPIRGSLSMVRLILLVTVISLRKQYRFVVSIVQKNLLRDWICTKKQKSSYLRHHFMPHPVGKWGIMDGSMTRKG